MYSYRVKHNLSYQMFADIINKSSFHNLIFHRNFVVKKIKENYTRLLKIEKTLATSCNQFFFQLIQRTYLLNDWKIYHLSPITKPKQSSKLSD